MLQQDKQKIEHLNTVLGSIRDVTRLIIKEKDRDTLIQGICNTLTEKRGFHNAWIVLIDQNYQIQASAQSGLDDSFNKILKGIREGQIPQCCLSIFDNNKKPELIVVENPLETCLNCPVSYMYDHRGSLSTCISHHGHVYGVVTVSVPVDFCHDEEEHELFKDVADDIAYALNSLEVEEDRRRKEAELRDTRDKLELRVSERTQKLATLSARLMDAQEEERKRIAGDLHDGIGQCLSAVKFMVETSIKQMEGKADEMELTPLKALVPLLQETSEEVRNIIMNLRPTILDDLGVLATIQWFCRQFRAVYSHIQLKEFLLVDENEVPDLLKITVFRILQEAMNNIAKYSQASQARISLNRNQNRLKLIVADNGRGFNVREKLEMNSTYQGLGLTGMKERTELSGGRFSIFSTHEKGTRIEAVWDYTCDALIR